LQADILPDLLSRFMSLWMLLAILKGGFVQGAMQMRGNQSQQANISVLLLAAT
jgi:hypothetical protein